MCAQVVNGTFTMQKEWLEQNQLEFDEEVLAPVTADSSPSSS
jgi:hypothetical protein